MSHKSRNLTAFLFIIVFFILGHVAFAALPSYYQEMSATEKQSLLWNNILASNLENGQPSTSQHGWGAALKKIKAFFTLKTTFDHESDEIPHGRIKIIHENGSVGKIKFNPTPDHPFTGIFQTGGIGLARLSLAVNPEKSGYVPGIAVKFLINNQPSLNIVAMHSLEGQGEDWNFFAKNFTTAIDNAQSFTLKILERVFKWTHNPANDLPVSHLSEIDTNSDLVAEPVSPTMLTLVPSKTVQAQINPKSRTDFRTSLSSIPIGPLYEIYGNLNGVEYHIGSLVLDSTLVASEYGDRELFFQHKRQK